MVRVSAGAFRMGPLPDEAGRGTNESVAHVRLTQDFLIGRYPVTQSEYAAFVEDNRPAYQGCPACPMAGLSWLDAVRFTNTLNERLGLTPCYDQQGAVVNVRTPYDCTGYRLPTEAEWEFAARAGSPESRYGDIDDIAWYAANCGSGSRPVGGRHPNAWGLHDTLGNVFEFVFDSMSTPLPGGDNPAVIIDGAERVMRGASCASPADRVRAAARTRGTPSTRYTHGGFRLARRASP